MPNVHTPARQPGETQAEYRERRAASKRVLFRATHPPMQAPATSHLDVSRFWLGQHTNAARATRRQTIKLERHALGIKAKAAQS